MSATTLKEADGTRNQKGAYEEGPAVKKGTRLHWIAGIAGATVGAVVLIGASPGTGGSADGYDLALLSDDSLLSPPSGLPDDFDLATSTTTLTRARCDWLAPPGTRRSSPRSAPRASCA